MGPGEILERWLRDVANDDAHASVDEVLGDRKPDPAGTRRDKHALSGKPGPKIQRFFAGVPHHFSIPPLHAQAKRA